MIATDTGKISQVLGNVVDVEFTAETLPNIRDALVVDVKDDSRNAATERRRRAS